MSQILLEDVRKLYGVTTALDGISLAFADGVTTAVVGVSGSGKSTLLQLINGLERPTSGNVRVFGEPVDYSRLPALRRQIGYAVQGTGLFPHMTVMSNISLLARIAAWSTARIDERARQLMELVELPVAFADRYPHELSGGEQQRVGLCRAMMLSPRVFLLDEPFGALDPITKSDIHGEFIRLQHSEPRTTVLVTHDLREAMKLAQHIVVLHAGRVLQLGTSEEVAKAPADEFVRSLFAAQLG